MLAIVSLLVIVAVSIIITRIAAIALVHTGLSQQIARFQARSAFTGAGFTTSESERVVKHPVRRRIVLLLMLLGNVGIVSAVSSLMLSFVTPGDRSLLMLKVVLLVAGLVALWAIASSQWVDKRLSHLIDRALKRYTRLEVRDFASVLHLAGEYRIAELYVEDHDWLANKSLLESRLREEGIVVLGITRADSTYLGVPKGTTLVLPEDTLLVYGQASALEALDERRASLSGELEHRKAVVEQQKIVEAEQRADKATQPKPR
ncbi:MAG: TrkA C-terminal domain-containing protein [Gammaproteobacteria bacterium]